MRRTGIFITLGFTISLTIFIMAGIIYFHEVGEYEPKVITSPIKEVPVVTPLEVEVVVEKEVSPEVEITEKPTPAVKEEVVITPPPVVKEEVMVEPVKVVKPVVVEPVKVVTPPPVEEKKVVEELKSIIIEPPVVDEAFDFIDPITFNEKAFQLRKEAVDDLFDKLLW